MAGKGFDRFMIEIESASNIKLRDFTDAEFRCLVQGVWPLAAKGPSDLRGFLTVGRRAATAEDVAWQARCSTAIARKTLVKMRSLEMLEPRGEFEYCHDWHAFNPDPRPSETPEAWRDRKRRSRGSHGDVPRDMAREVTELSRVARAGVPQKSRPEVEVEVEEPPLTPPDGGEIAPRRPRTGRGRDFDAYQDQLKVFTSRHFPGVRPDLVASQIEMASRGGEPTADRLRPLVENWAPVEVTG